MEVKFRATGVFILLGLTLFFAGCADKGDSEGLITVSPESAVVTLGGMIDFDASPADIPVTWSIDDMLGFDEGTIDSDGVYTAPSDSATAPEKVTIRATDPSSGSSGRAIAFLTTFNPNTRLTTNYTAGVARADTYSAGQKSIALYKDGSGIVNIYAVWADDSQGFSRVWFVKSNDDGNTFSTPVIVDIGFAANEVSPAIAVDGSGNVFVVWEDYEGGDADIFIMKYDGSGFSGKTQVNAGIDIGVIDYDTTPAIAVNSLGDIYVVWEHRADSSDEYPDLYFAQSTNQGGTFSAPVPLANNGRRPSIAIDSLNTVYVVWEDLTQFPLLAPTHVMIRKVIGTAPDAQAQVDAQLTPNYHARYPSVAVGTDGRVYVVWQRALILTPGFNGEIISTYDIDLAILESSTLTGNILSPFPDGSSAGLFGGKAYPSIAADSSNIYVAWGDQRNGTKDIYFARSSDGVTFTKNRIVNDNTGTWNEKPSIAGLDGKAYAIWTDHRNTSTVTSISPNDVFFARE